MALDAHSSAENTEHLIGCRSAPLLLLPLGKTILSLEVSIQFLFHDDILENEFEILYAATDR